MLLYGESETLSACINDTDELTQAVTRNNSKKLKHSMKERGHSTQVKIKDAEKAPEKSRTEGGREGEESGGRGEKTGW